MRNRNLLLAALLPMAAGVAACETQGPTESSDADSEVSVFDPEYNFMAPPDGGTCPDVYSEDSELLENGVTITWTSGLAGFDYTEGTDYLRTVAWSVDQGGTTFDGFTVRTPMPSTWTPVGPTPVDGTMTSGAAGDGTVDVTVNMTPMHDVGSDPEDADDDGWAGQIGNGHFWLLLTVDDGDGNAEAVKLGVNFHLEDPADGFESQCPT